MKTSRVTNVAERRSCGIFPRPNATKTQCRRTFWRLLMIQKSSSISGRLNRCCSQGKCPLELLKRTRDSESECTQTAWVTLNIFYLVKDTTIVTQRSYEYLY